MCKIKTGHRPLTKKSDSSIHKADYPLFVCSNQYNSRRPENYNHNKKQHPEKKTKTPCYSGIHPPYLSSADRTQRTILK